MKYTTETRVSLILDLAMNFRAEEQTHSMRGIISMGIAGEEKGIPRMEKKERMEQ